MATSSNKSVLLNVGGHRFATSLSTLTREPDSMLSKLFSEEWHESNESHPIFIDRDGRHFHFILNYLRDGPKVHLTDNVEILRELLNEVDYYQLTGLRDLIKLKLDLPIRLIQKGDVVSWRPEAIEYYWRPFALAIVHGIREGFLYDKVGKKYNDTETMASCIGCAQCLSLNLITVFDYRIRSEEWEALKHHMKFMRGVVQDLIQDTCCIVEWANGSDLHIPITAIVPADLVSWPF